MKQLAIYLVFIALTLSAQSQENRFTLSGGYAFANLEDTDNGATGFRINGLWEYRPTGSKFSQGFSFGYLGTNSNDENQLQTEYKINDWPFYYAPKFYVGKNALKGFVKGALGFHFSSTKRITQATELKGNDFGFYGGAGLGAMLETKKSLFFNIEYEWAYLSNSFYRDGFMNSAMLGIGFKF